MNPRKGYYSIIQYCPDLGRFEAANIGVLVFCPETGFLKALTANNNRRIIKFFGSAGHDWHQINLIKKGLHERLEHEQQTIHTLEQLQHFIALRANSIQLTAPRPIKLVNPAQDLENLFHELIGREAKAKERRNLKKYVREKLLEAGLERKLFHDVKVDVPVLKREVSIPFGFQNGRFNLIAPVRFSAADPEHSINTACKYAIEGRSLYENPDQARGELQLVIVGQFRPHDEQSREIVKQVLLQGQVKLYTPNTLPKLIQEIQETGRDRNLVT